MNVEFRYVTFGKNNPADLTRLEELTQLINDAYRGISGAGRWTTEHHLVEGDRINPQDLNAALEDPAFELIIALTVDNNADGRLEGRIVACIGAKLLENTCEFGTFAVLPELHGRGLGKTLLAYAEERQQARCGMFQVVVVEANSDLIRFYEKRGYTMADEHMPYPTHLNVGKPKLSALKMVVLRKPV